MRRRGAVCGRSSSGRDGNASSWFRDACRSWRLNAAAHPNRSVPKLPVVSKIWRAAYPPLADSRHPPRLAHVRGGLTCSTRHETPNRQTLLPYLRNHCGQRCVGILLSTFMRRLGAVCGRRSSSGRDGNASSWFRDACRSWRLDAAAHPNRSVPKLPVVSDMAQIGG
jgi:hypothetical protein